MRSLLAQNCADALQIYVVDDNSTDGTADAARSAALSELEGHKLHIVSGRPLPPDWSGKLWALQQGIDAAMALDPQFLVLTDADVEHAPDNLATLVSIAERENHDLVSFMVKLHCRSLAEKLLIPAFVFFFFMLYPPLWIRSPRRKMAGAAGGCILIRPSALAHAGGINAIRHEVIDDCALARAVKASGGRVWLGLTPTTQLPPLRDLWRDQRMIARTAFNQLGHSIAIFMARLRAWRCSIFSRFALFCSLAIRDSRRPRAFCLRAIAITYLPIVRFYGLASPWALTLPLSRHHLHGSNVDSAFKFGAARGRRNGRDAPRIASPPCDGSPNFSVTNADFLGRNARFKDVLRRLHCYHLHLDRCLNPWQS